MYLEQTYTLSQTYLENLNNYRCKFNAVDEQTPSETIGKYIEDELVKSAQETLASDINSLHEQLEYIVYLIKLFYYYTNSMKTLSSWDKYFNQNTYIERLKKISALAQEKQSLLNSNLQIFIKGLSQKDKAAENLIENEIKYLNAVSSSALSSETEEANLSYLKIDIEEMKSQSDKDSKKLQEALDRYNDRCDKEKGNQPNTPSSPTENTTMPELKKDTFEEQEKNKAPDSGNYSDDASEASDYEDALESVAEQPQTTSHVKNNDIEESLETPAESIIHTQNQEQNASNKNELLTQLWDLLIKAWQYIKNIFQYFSENNDLNNADRVQASHPAPQQSTFEESIPPLATGTQKPAPTAISVTNTSQTLFATNKTTGTIEEKYNRAAEWISRHLPKFDMSK
ncbi:hypothetical protein [Rickettsiella endosymbiont of Dermanyssus gallinae]|uniref:hypothetical protein n=1 Tax=Rickettsiella endosymbiont of Dermanyssus gallinae TaxID=2856608 RepID=UPI001C52BBDB|nr:hypothetical protein [Rickettsiella endosymbiont of Dermanyssus gallinae]